MKKLLIALMIAGSALAPGGAASASDCIDEAPPVDPNCDIFHDYNCGIAAVWCDRIDTIVTQVLDLIDQPDPG